MNIDYEENFKKEFPEIANLEPVGCDFCLNNSVPEKIVSNFVYEGSIIGPFTVREARLFVCDKCGLERYHSFDARFWEVEKAREIKERGSPYTTEELKFLTQTNDLNRNVLFLDIYLNKNHQNEFTKFYLNLVKDQLRPIAALMDSFAIMPPFDKYAAEEVIRRLTAPENRDALKAWYKHIGESKLNQAAEDLREKLSKIIGEKL